MNEKLERMLNRYEEVCRDMAIAGFPSTQDIGLSAALEIDIKQRLKQHPELQPKYDSIKANYTHTLRKRDARVEAAHKDMEENPK